MRAVAERTDGLAAFVAESACKIDVADPAFMNEFHHLTDRPKRTALRTDLADTAVLFHRRDHAFAFKEVLRGWFFNVNVLSRLHCPDRGETVPEIRRRTADGIEVFVGEGVAHIFYELRTRSLFFFDLTAACLTERLIRIHQVRDDRARIVEESVDVRSSAASDTENSTLDLIVRSRTIVCKHEGRGDGTRGGTRVECRTEKITAGKRIHFWFLFKFK